MTTERKHHWDKVYTSKAVDEVSWYQENPAISLQLIQQACPDTSQPIIDIGAGASRLADALVENAYRDISLLDISQQALNHTRERLQNAADKLEFIVTDITEFTPTRQYQLWHDRAVFHFLTEASDRRAYIQILKNALASNGHLVIAAFSLNGPSQCSGLDIVQYDADKIMHELGDGFSLLQQIDEAHMTPAEKQQDFCYYLVKKEA